MIQKLEYDFFNRPTLKVAEELLGKKIVFYGQNAIITEVESYIGTDDPASHAFKGRTPRTEVMYGRAGQTYVYLIYGMYNCLNFVTEAEGKPAAVLIRGVRIVYSSLEELQASIVNEVQKGNNKKNQNHNISNENQNFFYGKLLDGPGKLCKYLGIHREHNNINITQHKDFYLVDEGIKLNYKKTERIGISKGKDKLWRYVAEY